MRVVLLLNHFCNVPGAIGAPGSRVTCDEALADTIVAQGGGRIVERLEPPPAPEPVLAEPPAPNKDEADTAPAQADPPAKPKTSRRKQK
ncbi:MAG: hypothetical protein HC841_00535 [Verrucomicrobiae bacterium]|nr:hypothetical protein [Verrucomicrobiae bacterium]